MKGFSLIETLTALVIIAVLAAVALPHYQNAVQSARNAEAVTAWGHAKRMGSGRTFSDRQAARYAEQASQRLKHFTARLVCEDKDAGEICWEARFELKNPDQSIQYYLATRRNLQELLCVPLNGKGENFCRSYSGQEDAPDAQADGRAAYAVRH